ncbi:unnamed protein product [Protopolystoma xenopodis]|uniref:Uncharacterized protein n=1 Tax=Protopolystoma xenopodis TaxID=117903 RepID=A0A3S5AH73_9PLAT|nr:unnamed protein product [Protopolystoma xenopodis]
MMSITAVQKKSSTRLLRNDRSMSRRLVCMIRQSSLLSAAILPPFLVRPIDKFLQIHFLCGTKSGVTLTRRGILRNPAILDTYKEEITSKGMGKKPSPYDLRRIDGVLASCGPPGGGHKEHLKLPVAEGPSPPLHWQLCLLTSTWYA